MLESARLSKSGARRGIWNLEGLCRFLESAHLPNILLGHPADRRLLRAVLQLGRPLCQGVRVRACDGPEPAGNKQIVTIGDERQLSGIPVHRCWDDGAGYGLHTEA